MFAQGLVVLFKVLIEMIKDKLGKGLLALGLIVSLGSMSACGTRATANDMHVERLYGPDGSTCYVIVQEGRAVGGNCVAK